RFIIAGLHPGGQLPADRRQVVGGAVRELEVAAGDIGLVHLDGKARNPVTAGLRIVQTDINSLRVLDIGVMGWISYGIFFSFRIFLVGVIGYLKIGIFCQDQFFLL